MIIETTNKGLFCEIDLGYICNFKCSYCPEQLHSGEGWLAFKYIKRFLKEVKPSWLSLPGGEPTLYPQISKLILFCKDNDIKIALTTNGSKTVSWFEKYGSMIDWLIFTYHLGVSDPKFIEKIKTISKNQTVSINVPLIPERFGECLNQAKLFSQIDNVYSVLKPLIDNYTGEVFSYTPNQQIIISKSPLHTNVTLKSHWIDIFLDGKKIKPQEIIAKKNNKYIGWTCWKGIDLLNVKPNGDLYKSVCETGRVKPLGNIKNKYTIPTYPSICDKEYCNCMIDLKMIRKELL
jgi:MoaA/NifB/PqqE/SkfB family radical SAM enzyme